MSELYVLIDRCKILLCVALIVEFAVVVKMLVTCMVHLTKLGLKTILCTYCVCFS